VYVTFSNSAVGNSYTQNSTTLNGLTTSASVFGDGTYAIATAGTLPGCGGGAALVSYNTNSYVVKSAAGAPGAVYIYVKGKVE
jgi:hypothetical protein